MNVINQNGLYFELNNDLTAKLICSKEVKGDIYIPSSINYQSQDYILTKIDQFSFKGNKSIKSISLPDDSKIISIGKEAFSLSSLASISIPKHVQYIGEKSFYQCINLKTVTFSEDSELQIIDKEAFSLTSIQKISIPKSVIQIEDSTFSECRDLFEVNIPENSELKKIGEKVFSFTKIESLFIPPKLEELKEGWCATVSKLNDIKISPQNESFSIINNNLLIGKKLKASTNFDTILFAFRNIENSIIPSTIKFIDSYAFYKCYKFEKIDIPENSELISIGVESFMECSISKFFIPKHVKIINDGAFFGCTKLKSIIFHKESELEAINEEAFTLAPISTFPVPSHLTQIGKRCFSNCSCLKHFEIPENSELKIIGESAFAFSMIESLFIPSKLEELKKGWCLSTSKLNDIKISPINESFSVINESLLVGKSQKESTNFDTILFAFRNIENSIIPSTIKIIDSYAFTGCGKLKKVEFEKNSNLNSIKERAFMNTSLNSISIPEKVNHIDNCIFSYCFNLKAVEFLNDSMFVNLECFLDCESLLLLSFPNSNQIKIKYHPFKNTHIFFCSNTTITII